MPTSKNKRKNGQRANKTTSHVPQKDTQLLSTLNNAINSGKTIVDQFDTQVGEQTERLNRFIDIVSSESYGKTVGEAEQQETLSQLTVLKGLFDGFPEEITSMKRMIADLEQTSLENSVGALQMMMDDLTGFNSEFQSAAGSLAAVDLKSTS